MSKESSDRSHHHPIPSCDPETEQLHVTLNIHKADGSQKLNTRSQLIQCSLAGSGHSDMHAINYSKAPLHGRNLCYMSI